ncbi:MAG: biopolymer transporter Tol [Bacteroidota bacterium]
MRRLFFVIVFILHTAAMNAQEYFNHPELVWKTIETPHFRVHYHEGAERTGRTVAKIAEEIYGPVTSFYQHEPDQKVDMVIKDYDDYSNGAAYFLDNKIEFWAPALDFELRGTHNWLRNVVTHEFTHIIQIQTSLKFTRRIPAIYLQILSYESERRPDVLYGYPNVIVSYPYSSFVVPAWFAEGTAQYNRPQFGYDSWDTHRDMILRMYALDGKMLSWNEMAVFGKTSLGNESSYNAGFAFAAYLGQRYGDEKIREISNNLQRLDAVSIDGAIERALGKPAREIYNEWRDLLVRSYRERTDTIRASRVEGEIIGDVGFANLSPAFSPDGKKIAYISNKEADYFGTSSLFIYDCDTKREEEIPEKVRTQLSWSHDGSKIYYAKLTRENTFFSNLSDLFEYTLASGDERRITHGARGGGPDISPDGQMLICVVERDGTQNLATVDVQSGNVTVVTSYANGEQISSPRWSPDGREIVFSMAKREKQDIMIYDCNRQTVSGIVVGLYDARNPVFSSDGREIIFSSDSSGIFNLYGVDRVTCQQRQLTNVLGGALMPSVNASGDIAYTSYTSGGFKLALLSDGMKPRPTPILFVKYDNALPYFTHKDLLASLERHPTGNAMPWKSLREFTDDNIPPVESREYKNTFSSLSFFPVLRFDNYNTKNAGIDIVKPGIYIASNDVLDRFGLQGFAFINTRFERDLYLSFEYRDKIPLFYQLGLSPTLSLDLYSTSRKSYISDFVWNQAEIPLTITYGLFEFDATFRQPIYSDAHILKYGYIHSRYSSDISGFSDTGPAGTGIYYNGTSELYYIGNILWFQWEYSGIVPARTSEIRPVGITVKLRYEYEFSKFNNNKGYESNEGFPTPIYDKIRFHKTEIQFKHHFALPGWKHTLSVGLRGGMIFGPPVPKFFDLYAGGISGMKGYSFFAMGGNSIATVNLTYRFPISESLDTRFLQIYFDKLYGAIFADWGDAWDEGMPVIRDFKKDVGAELRLESFSFYAFPTRISLSAAYGLDQFNRIFEGRDVIEGRKFITYGKEWRLYFTVLFGFEL